MNRCMKNASHSVDLRKTRDFNRSGSSNSICKKGLKKVKSRPNDRLSGVKPSRSEEERDLSSIVSTKQIQVYKQVFEDIIKQNSVYGGLLENVKRNYDDYIDRLLCSIRDLKEQTLKINSQAQTSEHSKIAIRLKEENNKLAKDICQKEDAIRKLLTEAKQSKAREKKYSKLISVLQDKGIPVQEVYDQNIRRSKSTDREENLGIPKIAVPRNTDQGFHQEFMSLYDSFSESWRRQMEKQKR